MWRALERESSGPGTAAQSAISAKDLKRMMVEMAKAVDAALDEVVKEPETCDRVTAIISKKWREIRLQ